MKKNPLLFIGLLFAIIGSIFFGIGCVTFVEHNEFMETAVPVEAFIDSISVTGSGDDKDYDVHVYYKYNNETISNYLNFYSSSMHEGDVLTIYCDPMNPHRVESGSPVFSILFGGLGGVFAIIGFTLTISSIRSNKKDKKLKSTGQLINAQITNVFVDYNLTVNGRHPYKIECGYLAPNGQYFQFVSKGVWTNPQYFIGNVCPVYVNPNNPNEYYVDTSWLER